MPAMSRVQRVLRTTLQVLAALAMILTLAQANEATAGLAVPWPALVALVGASTLLVATVHNVVQQRGSTPILRTFLQIVVAVGGVSAAIVVELGEGGIDLPAEAIAAISGLAVIVATVAMNLLEQLGVLPELGKDRTGVVDVDPLCVGCDPVAPHGRNRELIDPGEVR